MKVKDNKIVEKTLAVLTLASGFVALYFTNYSAGISPWNPDVNKFVYENIGNGATLAAFALGLLLSGKQKTIFWPWANKNDRAKWDEREKTVRQRVIERAYWWVPLMTLLTSMSRHNSEHHLTQIFVWVVASWYFFLPAVIGAFQKDI